MTEYDAGTDSFGDEVTTIRIDGISYEQYVEYCKILQALPGWEVYEGTYLEDVEHLPDDYNSVSKTHFTGIYGGLQHIAVQYYSDKNCKTSGYPHFCMFIFKTF